MYKYTKIETVFKRDMEGTKKLIEGDFRNKTVEYLQNNQWIFTEKVDGTNIGIYWDGHNIHFQGRTERAQLPATLIDKLDELFGGTENEELFEQKFGGSEVVIFGEGYGPGIQKGGKYRSDVSFIVFDVYVPAQNLWLERDSVEDIARAFGVDAVPIIFTGTIQDAVDFVKRNPKSTMGTANMEGLVGKPVTEVLDRRGNRVIVKIKCCDFIPFGFEQSNIC